MAQLRSPLRRGSAAVIAMIMVLSTMTIALVMVSLSSSTRTKQTRQEDIRVVRVAFDGGVDFVRDKALRGVLRMPQTVTCSFGNVQESLVLTDVSTSGTALLGLIPLTQGLPLVHVEGTLTYKGQTYRMQRVIGRGLLSTVWQYALYEHTAQNMGASALITAVPGYEGDVWINGAFTSNAATTRIAGDLTSTSTISPSTINVDGKKTANSPSISFPKEKKGDYEPYAIATVASVNGYNFPAADANGYPVLFSGGALSIRGSFSGSGVIFAEGSVTIDGDITVTGGGHLVIIGHGNMTVQNSTNSIMAYVYCGGTITIPAAATPLTIQGGLVTDSMTVNRDLIAGFDPTVRDNPAEAYRLKLPGVWP